MKLFGSTYSDSGANMVFVRGNANLTDMVYLKCWKNASKIIARQGGVDTDLLNIARGAKMGEVWKIECVGNQYTVTVNGTEVGSVTSSLIPADVNHRYGGLGMSTENGYKPGAIISVIVSDNVPVSIKGTGALILPRAGQTHRVTHIPNGIATLPMSFWESPESISDDINWVDYYGDGGGYFELEKEGWYTASLHLELDNSTSSNVFGGAALAVSGSDGWTMGNLIPMNSVFKSAQITTTWYSAAGGLVGSGYMFSNNSIRVTANGVFGTPFGRFSVAKLG